MSEGLNRMTPVMAIALTTEPHNSTATPSSSSYSSSGRDSLKTLLWQYEQNRAITTPWHYVFFVSYIVIGVTAIFANSLVVLAVARNKKVRTPRNLLIFNLAVTDMALAATIPLSATDALSKYWPWGRNTDWLCKIARSAPTTLVFMVSVIIIVIAADRYRCIVMRTHSQMSRLGAITILPVSLAVASTVSIPLLLHSQLVLPQVSRMSDKLGDVAFCMERWSHTRAVGGQDLTHRALYSIVVAGLQYLLPLLIVLIIYTLIYRFLREQQYPRHLRQSKTNGLLATISLTHCVIWLPFSLFNIMADLWPDKLFNDDPEVVITVYCAVHLIGLTSTCTNPVLYAFFNENLRREFDCLLEYLVPGLYRSHSASSQRSHNTPRSRRHRRHRRRRCREGSLEKQTGLNNGVEGGPQPRGGDTLVAVTTQEVFIDDDEDSLSSAFQNDSSDKDSLVMTQQEATNVEMTEFNGQPLITNGHIEEATLDLGRVDQEEALKSPKEES